MHRGRKPRRQSVRPLDPELHWEMKRRECEEAVLFLLDSVKMKKDDTAILTSSFEKHRHTYGFKHSQA